jgi:hypothetical protein
VEVELLAVQAQHHRQYLDQLFHLALVHSAQTQAATQAAQAVAAALETLQQEVRAVREAMVVRKEQLEEQAQAHQ